MLHIAERHAGLLATDADARARAIAWMFAAKSTIEPPIVEREATILLDKDKNWFDARLPMLDARVRTRLADFAARLGEADWIERDFSAADLVMVTVLRRPAALALIGDTPNLAAYIARAETRPAFRRAFEAQHALFKASEEG